MSKPDPSNRFQFGLKSLLILPLLVAFFFAGRFSRQAEIDELKNPLISRMSTKQLEFALQKMARQQIARAEAEKRNLEETRIQRFISKYTNDSESDSKQNSEK